jgi:hypothetical protein
MSDVSFDRVVVKQDGKTTSYTVPEFMSLPLAERIRFILGRQVSFFLGNAQVDPKVALASMRPGR